MVLGLECHLRRKIKLNFTGRAGGSGSEGVVTDLNNKTVVGGREVKGLSLI